MTVDEINALPAAAARDAFTACCGAPGWVSRMGERRPFAGRAALLEAAETSWRDLAPDEQQAAITHHPRIGESRAVAPLGARAGAWSAVEQSLARGADGATSAALAAANAEYERRFGHAFIICASGKSAREILDALESRLGNDADAEHAVTSGELWKITRLRIRKLLDEP